ncbi:flavodoxin family protein [Vibrio parahaemolyticus]|uniref:NAD(P)H-dependent oxidoreductase n=1 Tax=Vibrio parahaemolyticus TaxID=670 RepID=UPI0001BC7242|nr:NAD(P)H-dependent oxidoreductase [Vibrio parahaemolyticus]EFO44495.1 MdaB protein [Vibrio parahaemolyticus AQ4037]EJG1926100.1 NAD(P)H-dependent oxidoreductase [Vibrio parahaemolyticus]EJL6385168.1 NAD(P)H-dependent oxidoreductase [Vibrio parahaemolyticus]EXF68835.1 NADPH-dependent FMN reductase family protein [Vibrio parahaemolyticus AQ3810]TNY57492.1 flavodoxin family protein [Vibrio parahaemolyticus]
MKRNGANNLTWFLAACQILWLACINAVYADEPMHETDVKTLVIVSHPYPERSVMTRGMQQAAESVEGVTVRNLETIYGFDTRAIDAQKERELTKQHDRIVFIFPTHWFNITPMMKAYMNDVWGSVGPGLWQGKEMLLVTTAAGGASTYGESGRIGVKLEDVFLPMKASALHAGMTYLTPLAFQSVSRSKLPDYQQVLIERLKQ